MQFDFCDISTIGWYVIIIMSLIGGALIGFILQLLFKDAGIGLSASRMQTLLGGCLLPAIAGLLSAYGLIELIPDDPCGGAYTPDAVFLPQFILPLTTLGAVTVFFIFIWRR